MQLAEPNQADIGEVGPAIGKALGDPASRKNGCFPEARAISSWSRMIRLIVSAPPSSSIPP
jgi:hypothetical protein